MMLESFCFGIAAFSFRRTWQDNNPGVILLCKAKLETLARKTFKKQVFVPPDEQGAKNPQAMPK